MQQTVSERADSNAAAPGALQENVFGAANLCDQCLRRLSSICRALWASSVRIWDTFDCTAMLTLSRQVMVRPSH